MIHILRAFTEQTLSALRARKTNKEVFFGGKEASAVIRVGHRWDALYPG